MNSVVVLYGEPTDPAAFESYYRETHAPLAAKVPGLRQYTHGRCSALEGAPVHHYFARLVFDTADDRAAALGSAEMGAAVQDVPNFASGGASIVLVDEESAL